MCKYYKNEIVEGCVTGIEKYGIFITLDEYYSGLIHISEISYGFVKDVNDFVNVGDEIYAQVISVDDDNSRLKLSIKDIDYKNDGKEVKRIPESVSVFEPLKEHLDIWINEKIKEVMNKM